MEILRPDQEDCFVLKPKHSAFVDTPLAMLLPELKAQRLVWAGIAADSWVMASAQHALTLEYPLQVRRDCVASHCDGPA